MGLKNRDIAKLTGDSQRNSRAAGHQMRDDSGARENRDYSTVGDQLRVDSFMQRKGYSIRGRFKPYTSG